MNLYLIEQNVVNGYDTFDSVVVQAESAEEARNTHPYGDNLKDIRTYGEWVKDASLVKVTFLGTTTPSLNLPKIICTSFNAG